MRPSERWQLVKNSDRTCAVSREPTTSESASCSNRGPCSRSRARTVGGHSSKVRGGLCSTGSNDSGPSGSDRGDRRPEPRREVRRGRLGRLAAWPAPGIGAGQGLINIPHAWTPRRSRPAGAGPKGTPSPPQNRGSAEPRSPAPAKARSTAGETTRRTRTAEADRSGSGSPARRRDDYRPRWRRPPRAGSRRATSSPRREPRGGDGDGTGGANPTDRSPSQCGDTDQDRRCRQSPAPSRGRTGDWFQNLGHGESPLVRQLRRNGSAVMNVLPKANRLRSPGNKIRLAFLIDHSHSANLNDECREIPNRKAQDGQRKPSGSGRSRQPPPCGRLLGSCALTRKLRRS